MIKISIAALIAIMLSGCSENGSCNGVNIKWFWENNKTTDCNCYPTKETRAIMQSTVKMLENQSAEQARH